jgi:hypothetical protein
MIRLTKIAYKILGESLKFTNWKTPSIDQLKQEFKVEQTLKGNTFFKDEEDFLDKVSKGKILTITESEDQRIGYRSHTDSYESLLSLIKSYRSYPEYRNEKTLKALYDGFKQGKPMDLPLVLEFQNGRRRVFAGNTRLDVAFQLDVNPVKVLMIYLDK